MGPPNHQHGVAGLEGRVRWLAAVLALAAVYFGLGKLGLSLAFLNASATPVWPATGVALAVLLLYGWRLWPGVFLGAFLVNITTQGSVFTTFGIAAGNTLEAVVGAVLVRRFASGAKTLDKVATVLKFIFLAALLSTMVSATFGVTSLCLGGFAQWQQYGAIWLTWWLGDAVSALLLAPLVMLWATRHGPWPKAPQLIELAALFTAIFGLSYVVFVRGREAFAYLTILPCLWAVFRFGRTGGITSVFTLSCIALLGTLHGQGPFASSNPNTSLLLLELFTGTITVAALVMGALSAERRATEQRLQFQHAVSRLLAESPKLDEATPRLLRTICEKAGWDLAAIWYVNRELNAIACGGVWHVPSLDARNFVASTRETRFQFGAGLPGRVWSSSQPTWIADLPKDPSFPRAPLALEARFRTALAFPLRLSDRPLGVIECFSRMVRPQDEKFLQMIESVGDQLGQFIERKRAEEALHSSEELHRTVSETAADGIISIDEASIIISANPSAERIFGYTRNELIGKRLTDLMPERMRAGHDMGIQRYLRTGKRHMPWKGVELPGLHKDGHELPLEISFGVSSADGKHIFTGIVRDITERKRAQEQLRESEARLVQANAELEQHTKKLEDVVAERTARLRETIGELETFSYSIAHDMRAPLRAMHSFAAMLQEDEGQHLSATGRDYLRRIATSAQRLDALIQDVLSYSRVIRSDLKLVPVEVGPLIREIVESYPNLHPPNAEISVRGEIPRVLGNTAALTQVISNLLGNAVKFVREGVRPRVEISAQAEGENVRVWFADNGIGIAEEVQHKLFQMFQRLHSPEEYEGTGMGLTIVRKAVERMGGSVGVESAPGKGSRFWIELKKAPAA